jgi:glycosyltransferase involved in cell wall biosynthesis
MLSIHLISPYHGGSHKSWAEGWQQSSQHSITLHTLPDRFWKWRMHGGAVTLARRFLASQAKPDLIMATDMLDLTTFLALTRQQTAVTPTILYMHENQLTYPLPQDGRTGPMRRQLGERDHHYAFINFASMLAATHVFFNSHYHLESFFNALPNFLKHFPEYNELNAVATLRKKSQVLPVGINFQRLAMAKYSHRQNEVPLILWNQRWEYDKNPEAFFAALNAAAQAGHQFEVALCGQQYGKRPSIFNDALNKLGRRIIHVGHADLPTYRRLLWQADITISTAQVAERIRKAAEFVPTERLFVLPDCGCLHLPQPIAFAKLQAMVEGTKMVRQELAG